jgi:hypothetical protein
MARVRRRTTPKSHHGEHAQSNPDPHADDPVNAHARTSHRAGEKSGRGGAKEHHQRIPASSRDASDHKPSENPAAYAKEHAHAVTGCPQTDVAVQLPDHASTKRQKAAGHARQDAAAWCSSPPQHPHGDKEEHRRERQRNRHLVNHESHPSTEDESRNRPGGRAPQTPDLIGALRLFPQTGRFSCHRLFSRLPSAVPGRAHAVFERWRPRCSLDSRR